MTEIICSPLCLAHDTPRPCPICDVKRYKELEKDWKKFQKSKLGRKMYKEWKEGLKW